MEKFDNPALLIINIQVDFCSSRGFAAKLGRDIAPIKEILPTLKRFTNSLRHFKIPIIFAQYVARKDLSPKNVRINKDREEKARMCLLDSEGSQLYFLKPKSEEIIVKHRYYDAFAETELFNVLKRKKIKTLLIVGVRTELSVDQTAKRAVSEGFEVVIVSDLVSSYREKKPLERELLSVFDRYFGYVAKSETLIEHLDE